jgi:hypothetical protein
MQAAARVPFYAIGNGGTALEGGPSWIYSDRYTIEATVNGAPSNAVMQGPMLQAILEERFKVKGPHPNARRRCVQRDRRPRRTEAPAIQVWYVCAN